MVKKKPTAGAARRRRRSVLRNPGGVPGCFILWGRLAHAAASSAAGFAGLARVLDLTSHLQMYNEEALGESQCELSAVRARCSES